MGLRREILRSETAIKYPDLDITGSDIVLTSKIQREQSMQKCVEQRSPSV